MSAPWLSRWAKTDDVVRWTDAGLEQRVSLERTCFVAQGNHARPDAELHVLRFVGGRAGSDLRRALGVPTIFNILGPLTNPAGARRQVVGVFEDRLVSLSPRSSPD